MKNSEHYRRSHMRHLPDGKVGSVRDTTVHTSSAGNKNPGVNEAVPLNALLSLAEEPNEAEQKLQVDDAELRQTLKSFLAAGYEMLQTVSREGDQGRRLTDKELSTLIAIKNLLDRTDLNINDDDEEDRNIVFSFEHPEWTSVGFTWEEHLPWNALGVAPKVAAEWKEYGFTFDTASQWITDDRNNLRSRFTPSDAKAYRDNGVSVDVAARWTISSSIPGENAVKWINGNISRGEAIKWQYATDGNFDAYQDWHTLGVTDPEDAHRLTVLGSERIEAWTAAGIELEKVRDARPWEQYKDYGYSEADLAPLLQGGKIERPFADLWLKEKIPADQILTFVEKGYTPKRAATRIRKGVTADKAEDLRQGELVPGAAWKKVKSALMSEAAKHEGSVNFEENRGSGGFVTIIAKYDGPWRWEEYYIRLSTTGRFVSGNEGYGSERNSVADFLKTYAINES